VPGLHRPSTRRLVLELTQRLAEDYDALPLAAVTAAVQAAVAAAAGPDGKLEPNAKGVRTVVEVIEHLAREDLDELVAQGGSGRGATRTRAAEAPPAPRRSARRRPAG
jgi:hypothetical protein